jgi:hypothetical protein
MDWKEAEKKPWRKTKTSGKTTGVERRESQLSPS